MATQFRYLTQEQLISLGALDMTLANQDVEEAFRLFDAGECILPSKVVLRWGDEASERTTRGHMNAMPGYVGGKYAMAGLKWAAGFYSNPIEYKLPAVTATIVLNDPYKGIPVAIMDGTLISAVRTGAMGGVAAKYLARPDSKTVGVIGAGVQARTMLASLKAAMPGLAAGLVYDIRPERSAIYAQEMGQRLGMTLQTASTALEVATHVDILVGATSAVEPVLGKGWVQAGSLFLQMGAYECELEAMREFDKIVVDNWYEIQHREVPVLAKAKVAGIISDDDIYAHIGELINGKKPGRQCASERIAFAAVGMGIVDIAVATRLLREAERKGVGSMLNLWESPAFI